jgi:fibronectin-binding autotransporter adhesin
MHSSYSSRVRHLSSASVNSILAKGVLVAALLCCSKLQAANRTWSGLGADFLWNDATNWNAAIASGDNLTFAGTTRLNGPNNNIAGFTSGNLTFSAGAGAFVIGGNAFTIGSGNTITNSSGNLQTINNTLTLAGNSTWTETGTGGLTFGAVNLSNSTANNTLTVSGGAATSITGVIANGGTSTTSGLTYSGTSTLTLTGTNTYGGATTISSGTLQIGNGGATGDITSSSNIVDNGSLVFDSSSNLTYTAQITGTGSITQNGSGTITLAPTGGTNTETGIINLNAGIISVLGAGHLGAAPATVTANYLNFNGGTLEVTTNGGVWGATRGVTLNAGGGTWQSDVTGIANQLGGVVTGSGNFTKTGAGTLEFDGLNTNTGATIVSAGTLQVGIANATSNTSALTVASGATFNLTNGTTGFADAVGSIAGAGNITMGIAGSALTIGNDNTSTNFSGVISGVGSLTKVGTGTETLSGVNTYTGNTTISAGTLQVGGSGSLGSGTYAGTIANSGTLEYSSSANQTLSGAISGTGGLTKDTSSTSTLTLSSTTSSFTGGLNLNAGTVKVTANTNLGGAANNLTFNGGTLEVAGTMSTARTLTVGAGSTGTLQIDSGNTLTLGTGSVLSAGNASSILTVNGVNSTGTLKLGANQTFSGTLDLSNATLSLAGFNLTVGTLDITANSTIDFGGSSSSSILSVTDLVLAAGVTLTINNWNDEKEYFYSATSPGSQGLTPLNQVVFSGFSGNSTKWMSTDHEITPVPEPATYGAIFTAAALGLFFWLRLKTNAPRPVPVRVAVRY